jgi:hypothetical protein
MSADLHNRPDSAYLDRRPRSLAEVARARGLKEGAPVQHGQLGRGTIKAFAEGGRHVVVDFANGQRYTMAIEVFL